MSKNQNKEFMVDCSKHLKRDTRKSFWLGGNIFGYSTTDDETFQLFDLAEKFGLASVDTSSSYSNGKSELLLGEWLSRFPERRQNIFISTKVGLESGETARGLGSRKRINETLVLSLERLKTNYIDVLFIHSPDKTVTVKETVSSLINLKNENLIRAFGLCNATYSDVSEYIENILLMGGNPADFYVQNYFNWAKREPNYWLKLGIKHSGNDCKSVAYGILGRGLLTDDVLRSSETKDPHSRKIKNKAIRGEFKDLDFRLQLERVGEICQNHNTSLFDFAIAYSYYLVDFSVLAVRNINQLEALNSSIESLISLEILQNIFKEIKKLGISFSQNLGDPKKNIRSDEP